MASNPAEHYRAVVDMGSNGIRLSITDCSPATARLISTVYSDRVGISLYNAQYQDGQKVPIPQAVIDEVLESLQRFTVTCNQFGVSRSNVRILATEATRVAINSEDFCEQIKRCTGLVVEMLPKEEEGRIGAMGVASSFSNAKGLMMDLGGGSTQLTWILVENGEVSMHEEGSVSMPYGAAALMQRMFEADKHGGSAREELRTEIRDKLGNAVKSLTFPPQIQEAASSPQGLSLYLSGGGFRGWGYLLMTKHPVSPYPIPAINGFRTTSEAFHDVLSVQEIVQNTGTELKEPVFRVSERRASQVPAVALLVGCLSEALPTVKSIYFCQGGVREGSLFSSFSASTRAQNPYVVATAGSAPQSSDVLLRMLRTALPVGASSSGVKAPALSTGDLLIAFINTLNAHVSFSKDLQAASALRITTTGHLGAIHGVDHQERAALGLMLCERWGGKKAMSESDDGFYTRFTELVGADVFWWCKYVGHLGDILGSLYPAGIVASSEPIQFAARWDGAVLSLDVDFRSDRGQAGRDDIYKLLTKIEKLGKKKNRADGTVGANIELTRL